MAQFAENEEKWCVIVLAAGYGSRFLHNLKSVEGALPKGVTSLPKALLPISGIPLLDYWHQRFRQSNTVSSIKDVYILSNQRYYSQFVQYAITRKIPTANVINDRKVSSADNQTELSDLLFALNERQIALKGYNILVVAGDVLVDELFDLSALFTSSGSGNEGRLVTYTAEPSSSNGLDEVHISGERVNFLSDSRSGSSAGSEGALLALAPVYSIPSSALQSLLDLHKSGAVLPQSHGELVNWLIARQQISYAHIQCARCFNIDTVDEYLSAAAHFDSEHSRELAALPTAVSYSCPARVGLMGNPSDGFNGKTLSFVLENFCARVDICATCASDRPYAVELVPHPEFDRTCFNSLDHLHDETLLNVSTLRTMMSTCKSLCLT
jgi:glucuronokinase